VGRYRDHNNTGGVEANEHAKESREGTFSIYIFNTYSDEVAQTYKSPKAKKLSFVIVSSILQVIT
jgi:hypothetical protein